MSASLFYFRDIFVGSAFVLWRLDQVKSSLMLILILD